MVGVGWAIGAGEEYNDPSYRDEVEGKSLFDVLENDLVPLFYDLGSDRLPRKWIAKVKGSMKQLAPIFNTNRMVQQYTERYYLPALKACQSVASGDLSKHRGFITFITFFERNIGLPFQTFAGFAQQVTFYARYAYIVQAFSRQ